MMLTDNQRDILINMDDWLGSLSAVDYWNLMGEFEHGELGVWNIVVSTYTRKRVFKKDIPILNKLYNIYEKEIQK